MVPPRERDGGEQLGDGTGRSSRVVHGSGYVGLDWVGLGRDFSVFGGLGWVRNSKNTEIRKDYVNVFKAQPTQAVGQPSARTTLAENSSSPTPVQVVPVP